MSRQAQFAAALLDPQQPSPGDIDASRFAVYRNNVLSSLSNALADTYPVVAALVGADFFQAMAREFIVEHPPQTRILAHYGDAFAAFIEGFAPAASLAYLPDMARLEWARVQAYHAADRISIEPQTLVQALADPENLAQMRVVLHPSVQVLNSAFATVSLWAAHQDEEGFATLELERPENALIVRKHLDVLVYRLDAGQSAFIRNLQNGAPLSAALEAASTGSPIDLVGCLTLLIDNAAICALTY